MSPDEEKGLSRRSLGMWSSTNKPEEIFAASYINHQEPNAEGGVKFVGLEGWKEIVLDNHRAFSSFRVRVLRQSVEDELVATRWQFSPTHTSI